MTSIAALASRPVEAPRLDRQVDIGGVGAAAQVAQQPAQQGRPDLRAIERNYQVKDDTVAQWSPRGLGVIPIPFAPSQKLTTTEGRLLDNLARDRGLVGLNSFRGIRDQAFDDSTARFADPARIPPAVERAIAALPPEQQARTRAAWPGNDGHRDAFRHAYWNALLTREFGAEWTAQFATAHEGVPGNSAVREAMDLYNNRIGREIAVSNPDATPEQLADLVGRAVDEGRLVVVDQSGRLEWSDRVNLGQHGVAAPGAAPGVIGVPAGDASAQQSR